MARQLISGWRPSPPDHRDHMYRSPFTGALPTKVDLAFDPVFDQGNIGSCGPNSAVSDIIFAALRQDAAHIGTVPSRLFVYYVTRMVQNTVNMDSGVENRAMFKALAQYGWCDESLWPYDVSKFTVKPPKNAFDQAAGRKIVQYLRVNQSLDDMRACLASGVSGVGDPFVFGFTVYESFMSDAVAKTGIVPMPSKSEETVGGHDITFVGYDDTTQMFKFKNSWGTDWGLGGFAFMPYAYATNYNLAGDFWTARLSGLPAPIPPGPAPVPVPVPPSPTPIPIPPPSPTPEPLPGPSWVKEALDQIFKDMEARVASNPWLLWMVKTVHGLVLSYFATRPQMMMGVLPDQLKKLLLVVLKELEAQYAASMTIAPALQFVEYMVVTYL